jgi:hypothetical protein
MEPNNRVKYLNCPRCGKMAYLECAHWVYVDEEFAGYHPAFQLCLKCGYSGVDPEPIDSDKDAPHGSDNPNIFSGLICLKLKNGCFEFYDISGSTTDEIVSWFTSVLRKPNIDPGGSYFNKWGRKAKTLLRISLDQVSRGPEREEPIDEKPLW